MNTKCPAIISDVPDANKLAIDDEGMELPTSAVPQGAAKSLMNTAKHAVWTKAETIAGHRTSIDVRDGNGVAATFEVERPGQ